MWIAFSSMNTNGRPLTKQNQVGAAIVIRRADAGELQLAHGEKTVGTRRVAEVDHPGASRPLAALGIPVPDGNAASDQPVKVAVMLDHRSAEVVDSHFPQRVFYC